LVAHGLPKTVSSTSVSAAKARAAAVVVWTHPPTPCRKEVKRFVLTGARL